VFSDVGKKKEELLEGNWEFDLIAEDRELVVYEERARKFDV
jgi:hypothetical protein